MTTDFAATFCRQVRARTREHRTALGFAQRERLPAIVISILRMELDSLIRAIFLLQASPEARTRLLAASVNGERWTLPSANGKPKPVTDRDMVDLAQTLHGWTSAVYRFGCAFVHLSSFHDHGARDPVAALSPSERHDLLAYLRSYHGGLPGDDATLADLGPMLPAIFEKIAGNLECYLKELEGAGPGGKPPVA